MFDLSAVRRTRFSSPHQSPASFQQVHFSPSCLQSTASPQLSCVNTSSITAAKNAFISWRLVHNQTNFAPSRLEPSTKYSHLGNPFVDDWMQRGDSGFLLTHRGEVFTPFGAWGRELGLHSNLVFIGILISFQKLKVRSDILCSHNSPLISGKNKQNLSVCLLDQLRLELFGMPVKFASCLTPPQTF